jgi:hypothetical protein
VAATKQIEAIGVLARREKLTAGNIVIELERPEISKPRMP